MQSPFEKDMEPLVTFVDDPVPFTGVMLHGSATDTNLFQITPEFEYYAFLDELEEGYIEDFEDDRWNWFKVIYSDICLDRLEGHAGTTCRTGLDGEQKVLEKQSIIMAYFDCIRTSFFNGSINGHKAFYEKQFEWNIDEPRSESHEYQHSPEQALEHRKLNYELDASAGPLDYISVILLFSNTAKNWKMLRSVCPDEDWFGLRLIRASMGLPAEVAYGEDRENSRFDYSVKSICRLSSRRLNNLRHVVSLDFAPDAYLLEDPELVLRPPLMFVFTATTTAEQTQIDQSWKKRQEIKARKQKTVRERHRLQARRSPPPVTVPIVPLVVPPPVYHPPVVYTQREYRRFDQFSLKRKAFQTPVAVPVY